MKRPKGPCAYEIPPADAVEVPGFPHYVITPRGDVFSRFGAWKRKRLGVNSVGYSICGMTSDDGTRSWPLVHRIVARLFVPGAANGLTVNHRNRVKTDNRASNLEWITLSANAQHWRAEDPASVTRQREALRAAVCRPVLAEAGEDVRGFESVAAAARAMNGWSANICNAIKAGTLAYGFSWHYA